MEGKGGRTMTLSEHEQRTLDEMETTCRRVDPGFARRLDLAAVRSRRRFMAHCAIWVGLLALVIGAGSARGVLSAGTIVAGYGLVLILAGTVGWVRNRGPRARLR
jgi:hypothetical protein